MQRRAWSALASAVVAVVLVATGALAGETANETIRRSFAANGIAGIDVSNTNGNVTIVGRRDARDIVMVARVEARSSTREDARRALNEVVIDVARAGDVLKIDSELPVWWGGEGWRERLFDARSGRDRRNLRIDYEFTIPIALAASVRSVNGAVDVHDAGNVRIEGVNCSIDVARVGSVDVESVNGNVEIAEARKAVTAELVNGNVEYRTARAVQRTDISTINGAVSLVIPANIDADFRIRSARGDISFEGITLRTQTRERGSVDGRAGRGGPLVEIETVNGDIEISAESR